MSAPKATEAAVAAVQEALGCDRGNAPFGTGVDWHTEVCREHHRAMVVFGGAVSGRIAVWTERGCPVAVAAADAAAPHIAAQAWDEGNAAAGHDYISGHRRRKINAHIRRTIARACPACIATKETQ